MNIIEDNNENDKENQIPVNETKPIKFQSRRDKIFERYVQLTDISSKDLEAIGEIKIRRENFISN